MTHEEQFESAREARRLADLALSPSERLRSLESQFVSERPSQAVGKVPTFCDALNRARARYVLVGANAATLWGYARYTRDIDILIDATIPNAATVLQAMNDMGFILTRDLDPAEVASRAVTMIGDLYRVDLITIAWNVRYPEAAATARIFSVDGIPIPTISLDLLIESKRTDRLQDQADVEELEILRARLNNNP